MSSSDSTYLPSDLSADASAQPNTLPNHAHDKRMKKRFEATSRRQFLGQAGGATAAVLAVSAIGLEPLTGSKRSTARAIEVSPFTGDRGERAGDAEQIRQVAAANEKNNFGQPVHPTNGDEELYPDRIGNFHKTLPHNSIGEVDQAVYNQFLAALATGTLQAIENIPRHPGS